MASFEQIRNNLQDLAKNQKAQIEYQRRIQAQQKQISNQLNQLAKQKHDLENSQSKLQQNAKGLSTKLADTKSKLNTQQAQAKNLKEQLNRARASRNVNVMAWWMQTFAEFDNMTEIELEVWISQMIKKHPQSHRHVMQMTREEKERWLQNLKDNKQEKTKPKQKKKVVKKEPVQAGQTLPEKQRIQINRDENDPIDTVDEARGAESLERPTGTRDSVADGDKYLDQLDEHEKKLDRKKLVDLNVRHTCEFIHRKDRTKI